MRRRLEECNWRTRLDGVSCLQRDREKLLEVCKFRLGFHQLKGSFQGNPL
jgi:hypothetical protein